jgi:hypothetical protein
MSKIYEDEQGVVLSYFHHDPVQVHGMFESPLAAHEYAERQDLTADGGAYCVNSIFDIKENDNV